MGVWAVAADWVGSAARLTADLKGRVLTLGYLTGAEGHSCIILGLEQLNVLQSLESFWRDLLCTIQKIVVLTRVFRQVVEQWGLVSCQTVGGMTGRIWSGVTVGGALGKEMSLVLPIPNREDSMDLVWERWVEEDRIPWALACA